MAANDTKMRATATAMLRRNVLDFIVINWGDGRSTAAEVQLEKRPKFGRIARSVWQETTVFGVLVRVYVDTVIVNQRRVCNFGYFGLKRRT